MATIVYLDDDQVQHLLMKKLFRIHVPECKIEFFSCPEKLQEWLRENQADLLLSDLNLEGSSVWDWIDDFTLVSQAKLVLITAHATPEDRRKKETFSQVKMIFEKPLSQENWKVISELIF
jgi:DNA-binding NtrC family response regulator